MSGAQKRKIKKEKEQSLQKIPRIDSFINLLPKKPEENTKSGRASTYSSSELVDQHESNTEVLQNNSSDSESEKDNATVATEDKEYKDAILSYDLGTYLNKSISDKEKQVLIMNYHKPKGPFPKDPNQNNRSFSESYYSSTTKYGPVPRVWLCYSTILDAAYCHPCWLFSNASSQWRTGVRDWKSLSSRIKTHSAAQEHINACAIQELWKTKLLIKWQKKKLDTERLSGKWSWNVYSA